MKRVLIIALALGMALAAVCTTCMAGNRKFKTVKGSGKIQTERVEVGPFERIEARNSAVVTVVPGSGPLTVRADDNVMEYVSVKVENGTLRIGFDGRSCRSFNNVTLEVTVPSDGKLTGLTASGAAKIVAEPVLTGKEIELEASGASKLVARVKCSGCDIDLSGASKADIGGEMDTCGVDLSGASKLALAADCGSCDIDLSGASKAEVSGAARIGTFEASGASSLDAERFVTTDCIVDVSGASRATVHCTGKLQAEASSASKIVHAGGSTDNTIRTSSAGSVSAK